jgi:hypothetical protein
LSNGSAKGHLAVAGTITMVFECSIQFFFIGDSNHDLRVFLSALAPVVASFIGFLLYSAYASSSLPNETKLTLKTLKMSEKKLLKDLKCVLGGDDSNEAIKIELLRVRLAQSKLLSTN